MSSGGKFDRPMIYETPQHMICKLCDRCSTALDRNRVCWRHNEYLGETYLGREMTYGDKELPTPAKAV